MAREINDTPLALTEHLGELRMRVIKSVICVIFVSIVIYGFVDHINASLVKPVGSLVFIAPQEAFTARIKIAFFGGLLLSSPFILFQIWRFVSMGLSRNERKYMLIFGPLSFFFFVAGTLFGYFVIVPIGVKFLLGFATDFLTPMITINNYISFVGALVLIFGVIFELPLASLFLTKIGLVTPKFLSGRRREAIVIIFISAAVLTPPDVITQCLMAVPLLVLYEISIVFSKFAYRPT